MDWSEMDRQTENGELTPLAVALQAIAANGCACDGHEDGTCLACRCETALRSLWDKNAELEHELDRAHAAFHWCSTVHELARAHAAFHWCATVRQCVMSGMLRAHGEDAQRGLLNILAVAHAAAEVWLSRERVTAEAVARLLGWNAPHSALAVEEWMRPLQDGPYPPLVTEDGQPNISVAEE